MSGQAGFAPGQTILVDSGANVETVVVVSPGRGFGGGGSITIAPPLTRTHAAGAQISGTGITIMGALNKAHGSGAPVTGILPTPGAPNRYVRSSGRR